MVELYGKTLSRRQVRERSGMLSQFAGVRLMTLGDGVERGIRMLEFRTGSGLRFTALADRALDIADCDFKGQAIGWHSPSGFRHPGLHDYEGEGGWPGRAPFPACLSPAASTTYWAGKKCRPTATTTLAGRPWFIPCMAALAPFPHG